ncbi:MAG: hypothetical protein EB168_09580 [Euryarchaeota archaeon]|nr:hypothetical protein [Euryarchaeota archaeon]
MGWFSRNNDQPTQTFGSPNPMGGYGAAQQGQQMMGQDPMMMAMHQQNPMMAGMANDPVMATAKLLNHTDPVAAFIAGNNMGFLLDLLGEIITLSMKDFFANAQFKDDDGKVFTFDPSSLPTNLTTLSPENIRLTLQTLQSACQQTAQYNQQQIQMLLMSHNPMAMAQNQPGFFGSLLGGIAGSALQNSKYATGAVL